MNRSYRPVDLRGDVSEQTTDADVLEGSQRRYAGSSPSATLVYDVETEEIPEDATVWFDLLTECERGVWIKVAFVDDASADLNRFPYEHVDSEAYPTASFTVLPQYQARIAAPVSELTSPSLALLPSTHGCTTQCFSRYTEPVDLAELSHLVVTVIRSNEPAVEWVQTDLRITTGDVPELEEPTMLTSPLLDETGTLDTLPEEERSVGAEELDDRLRSQLERSASWPERFSRFGGDGDRQFEAGEFFHTHHDGDRWWLVDPDGRPFWSTGLNNVRVDVATDTDSVDPAALPLSEAELEDVAEDGSLDLLERNLRRTLGEEWADRWGDLAVTQLRDHAFNTIGSWSDESVAREAEVPYIKTLSLAFDEVERFDVGRFPDVFDPAFEDAAATTAEQLEATRDDPWMVGYFLGNHPYEAYVQPAIGVLTHDGDSHSRRELVAWLRERYGDQDDALVAAWDMDVTFEAVEAGLAERDLTDAAKDDLSAFSERLIERYYSVLCRECRAVDPNHLIFSSRCYPFPDWWLPCTEFVDVLAPMYYGHDFEALRGLADTVDLPILVSEWHFSATDGAAPHSGLCRVETQSERGEAYRWFLETLAAMPSVVGAHFFELYDQPALGKEDFGEAFNSGLLDVCHVPYEGLSDSVRTANERVYDLAWGDAEPTDHDLEFLPANVEWQEL